MTTLIIGLSALLLGLLLHYHLGRIGDELEIHRRYIAGRDQLHQAELDRIDEATKDLALRHPSQTSAGPVPGSVLTPTPPDQPMGWRPIQNKFHPKRKPLHVVEDPPTDPA